MSNYFCCSLVIKSKLTTHFLTYRPEVRFTVSVQHINRLPFWTMDLPQYNTSTTKTKTNKRIKNNKK